MSFQSMTSVSSIPFFLAHALLSKRQSQFSSPFMYSPVYNYHLCQHDQSSHILAAILRLNLLRRPVSHLRNLSAHLASAILSLDAAGHAHVGIQDESPQHIDPAVVSRQRRIELVRNRPQLRQPCPRHGGEVVVLIVVAHVVCEYVQRAVVAVCLGDRHAIVRVLGLRGDGLVDVVLGNEVACSRVQATGEEGRKEEVEKRLPGIGDFNEDSVEDELNGEVDEMHPGEGHLENTHGPDGVEEDLEGAKEGFAKDRIKDNCFEGGGEIGVQAINAQGLVMRKVVRLATVFMLASPVQTTMPQEGKRGHTLNEALYGTPMGRFAKMAKSLLASGDRKARLCEISWMARKRFWLAVAPTT